MPIRFIPVIHCILIPIFSYQVGAHLMPLSRPTTICSLNCIRDFYSYKSPQDLAADYPFRSHSDLLIFLNFYYTHAITLGSTSCFSTDEQYQEALGTSSNLTVLPSLKMTSRLYTRLVNETEIYTVFLYKYFL